MRCILIASLLLATTADAKQLLTSDYYPKEVIGLQFLIACDGETISHVRPAVNNRLEYDISNFSKGHHECSIQAVAGTPPVYSTPAKVGFDIK